MSGKSYALLFQGTLNSLARYSQNITVQTDQEVHMRVQVHIAKVKPHNMLQYRLPCPHCHHSRSPVEGLISANGTG